MSLLLYVCVCLSVRRVCLREKVNSIVKNNIETDAAPQECGLYSAELGSRSLTMWPSFLGGEYNSWTWDLKKTTGLTQYTLLRHGYVLPQINSCRNTFKANKRWNVPFTRCQTHLPSDIGYWSSKSELWVRYAGLHVLNHAFTWWWMLDTGHWRAGTSQASCERKSTGETVNMGEWNSVPFSLDSKALAGIPSNQGWGPGRPPIIVQPQSGSRIDLRRVMTTEQTPAVVFLPTVLPLTLQHARVGFHGP